MKLTLKRFKVTGDATLGALYIDDKFECYTLEDEHRDIKVAGETRIPAGEYKLTHRPWGGFYQRYKERFKPWHNGMIQLFNVQDFTDILIHCGNTDDHTAGCILVGSDYNENAMTIQRSAAAYEKLYKQVQPEIIRGGSGVFITIQNHAGADSNIRPHKKQS